MREVVAKRIIEMAQRGVQDRETLVEDAVRLATDCSPSGPDGQIDLIE
jgi:hypothetical protein